MDFEISNIGIATAVAAGAVSFLSSCVLPLVPGYISFIAGNSSGAKEGSVAVDKLGVALLSLWFILGFSTVFVVLCASATALSRLLRAYSHEAAIVGGAIVILYGVFMTGLVRLPWLERDVRYHGSLSGGGPLGAYLLGLAFAFGWTPCIGPILGVILTVSAVSATAPPQPEPPGLTAVKTEVARRWPMVALEPLQRQHWLGPLLVAAYLRRRGKVASHLLAFSVGLRAVPRERRRARDRTTRMLAFVEAMQAAATAGLKDVDRLVLAKGQMERICCGEGYVARPRLGAVLQAIDGFYAT